MGVPAINTNPAIRKKSTVFMKNPVPRSRPPDSFFHGLLPVRRQNFFSPTSHTKAGRAGLSRQEKRGHVAGCSIKKCPTGAAGKTQTPPASPNLLSGSGTICRNHTDLLGEKRIAIAKPAQKKQDRFSAVLFHAVKRVSFTGARRPRNRPPRWSNRSWRLGWPGLRSPRLVRWHGSPRRARPCLLPSSPRAPAA